MCGNSPAKSSESYHVHGCESQSRVLTDACGCFLCIIPFHGSETCAGEIASGTLLRKGQRENRTAEEEHVRHQRCSKQLGTRLARTPRKLGLRAGAQFKELVPQQEKENLGFDTRRRLCGDRNEGESVGAQEATGERESNQSKHHRGGSTKSIKALTRRMCWGETGIVYQHDPRHVDVVVESLGFNN